MSKKLEWNLLNGPVLAIAAITLIGIGLVAVGSHTVTAGPALTPFNFKVKECKVDTSPDPVSCKSLKKMIKDLDISAFNLELRHVERGGIVVQEIHITKVIDISVP